MKHNIGMKHYMKAEWELYKRNRANLILGLCGLFVFCLLLLFSGIGTTRYVVGVSIVGFVVFWFFLIGWYLSPASYWANRQKTVIPTEQVVLVHGENKRTYLKIRLVVLCVLYLAAVSVIAVMQIPAALIAGGRYSLWGFGLQVMASTALMFLNIAMLYLAPSRTYPITIPAWVGFCGGIAGGILAFCENKTKEEAFDKFLVMLLIAVPLGLASILYRWIRTIGEERGGFRKKKPVSEGR